MSNGTNTIDLGQFIVDQAIIETSVRVLNSKLKAEIERLSKFNSEAKDAITKAIKAGQTTGDPLQDEIIMCFGLDREVIGKILAFSKKLVDAKGKEFLIAISYQKQMCFRLMGRGHSDDDFMTCWGYVFGTLSGERLKLEVKSEAENWIMTIPFSRHIINGFEHTEDRESTEGPVTVSGCLLEPSTLTILSSIMGTQTELGSALSKSLRTCARNVVILLGDEINYTDLRKTETGCLLNLEDIKERLKKVAPQEIGPDVSI